MSMVVVVWLGVIEVDQDKAVALAVAFGLRVEVSEVLAQGSRLARPGECIGARMLPRERVGLL